ncbi:rod shape-determining protein RodA, partial [bacterium]|nr:rod shape-determining protein RodA [bacterium]
LLLLSVFFLSDPAKGAARWIDLGFLNVQPSEPAKIAFILAFARLASDKKFNPVKLTHLLRALALTAVPLGLVLVQPDLGTSMVFAALGLSLLIVAGTPLAYLIVLVSPLFAALASLDTVLMVAYLILLMIVTWRLRFRFSMIFILVILNLGISLGTPKLWDQLKPYQKSRLVSFLQPEADPRGSGYQVIQSKVAIGSGGLTGKGLTQGSQTQLKFLPEQHTDFIFSVVGEELGFIGASFAMLLFMILILRGFRAALIAKGKYSAMVCAGVSSMLAFHVFINVGMTVGLMPVTGLPLPLLSYGGSFLWTVMLSLGLVIGIQRRWREYTP